MSKLTVFFIGVSIFSYAFVSRNRRKYLTNHYFYLSFLPCIIVGLFLVISDGLNGWTMLKYSAIRAGSESSIGYKYTFLTNQFVIFGVLFFPLSLILGIKTCWRYLKKKTNPLPLKEETIFLFAWTSFFNLCILLYYFSRVKLLIYWGGFFFIPSIFLVTLYLTKFLEQKKYRVLNTFQFVIFIGFIFLVVFHANYGVLDKDYRPNQERFANGYNIALKNFSNTFYEKFGIVPKENSDWLHRYQTIKSGSLKGFYESHMDKNLPIITRNFTSLSFIDFFWQPHAPLLSVTRNNFPNQPNFGNPYSIYDLIEKNKLNAGQDAYFLLMTVDDKSSRDKKVVLEAEKWLSQTFSGHKKIGYFISYRIGKNVGQYRLYKASGFLGY